jgi:cytochrome c5
METSESSGKFFIGSLVVVFLLFLVAQAILASSQNVARHAIEPISMAEPDLLTRIGPVAEAYVGEPPVIEVESEDLSPGERIVEQVCARCHRSGLMRSPKLGKAKDWAPRIEKGVKTLYDHAINGFNKMPARGGRASLDDEKIMAAVDHMISDLN